MKAVGEPEIGVQRRGVVGQGFDCGLFQRHRVLLELLKEPLESLAVSSESRPWRVPSSASMNKALSTMVC